MNPTQLQSSLQQIVKDKSSIIRFIASNYGTLFESLNTFLQPYLAASKSNKNNKSAMKKIEDVLQNTLAIVSNTYDMNYTPEMYPSISLFLGTILHPFNNDIIRDTAVQIAFRIMTAIGPSNEIFKSCAEFLIDTSSFSSHFPQGTEFPIPENFNSIKVCDSFIKQEKKTSDQITFIVTNLYPLNRPSFIQWWVYLQDTLLPFLYGNVKELPKPCFKTNIPKELHTIVHLLFKRAISPDIFRELLNIEYAVDFITFFIKQCGVHSREDKMSMAFLIEYHQTLTYNSDITENLHKNHFTNLLFGIQACLMVVDAAMFVLESMNPIIQIIGDVFIMLYRLFDLKEKIVLCHLFFDWDGQSRPYCIFITMNKLISEGVMDENIWNSLSNLDNENSTYDILAVYIASVALSYTHSLLPSDFKPKLQSKKLLTSASFKDYSWLDQFINTGPNIAIDGWPFLAKNEYAIAVKYPVPPLGEMPSNLESTLESIFNSFMKSESATDFTFNIFLSFANSILYAHERIQNVCDIDQSFVMLILRKCIEYTKINNTSIQSKSMKMIRTILQNIKSIKCQDYIQFFEESLSNGIPDVLDTTVSLVGNHFPISKEFFRRALQGDFNVSASTLPLISLLMHELRMPSVKITPDSLKSLSIREQAVVIYQLLIIHVVYQDNTDLDQFLELFLHCLIERDAYVVSIFRGFQVILEGLEKMKEGTTRQLINSALSSLFGGDRLKDYDFVLDFECMTSLIGEASKFTDIGPAVVRMNQIIDECKIGTPESNFSPSNGEYLLSIFKTFIGNLLSAHKKLLPLTYPSIYSTNDNCILMAEDTKVFVKQAVASYGWSFKHLEDPSHKKTEPEIALAPERTDSEQLDLDNFFCSICHPNGPTESTQKTLTPKVEDQESLEKESQPPSVLNSFGFLDFSCRLPVKAIDPQVRSVSLVHAFGNEYKSHELSQFGIGEDATIDDLIRVDITELQSGLVVIDLLINLTHIDYAKFPLRYIVPKDLATSFISTVIYASLASIHDTMMSTDNKAKQDCGTFKKYCTESFTPTVSIYQLTKEAFSSRDCEEVPAKS